jgi:hypothetical protein
MEMAVNRMVDRELAALSDQHEERRAPTKVRRTVLFKIEAMKSLCLGQKG